MWKDRLRHLVMQQIMLLNLSVALMCTVAVIFVAITECDHLFVVLFSFLLTAKSLIFMRMMRRRDPL